MLKKFISSYSVYFPRTIVYMLQSTEYKTDEYLAWLKRINTFSQVENRRQLDMTSKAQILMLIAYGLHFLPLVIALTLYILWLTGMSAVLLSVAVVLILAAPFVSSRGIVVPLRLGEKYIQEPRERKMIAETSHKLRQVQAVKIAIAGSYGKTTMREVLLSVLSNGKRVAATPGNYNTPHGVYRFVNQLAGDEEVLIFEFGEYYPGDVMELCQIVDPHVGVITGVNEAHLSKFKTIARTIATIFELDDYLQGKPVYKNADNIHVQSRIRPDDRFVFSTAGADGWVVSDIQIKLHGTEFVARKGDRVIHAESGMLGRHIVGTLVAAIAIAEHLGLSDEQIKQGIEATVPFEHRMSPRDVSGATIIDDTYNGNIDGVKAGIAFLQEVQTGGRRVYVTPGIVELGDKTEQVHIEIGQMLAPVADLVILMQNSVSSYIEQGLTQGGFKGEFFLIDKPLEFYKNIDHYVAAGDVVLMQNDWTDNYA